MQEQTRSDTSQGDWRFQDLSRCTAAASYPALCSHRCKSLSGLPHSQPRHIIRERRTGEHLDRPGRVRPRVALLVVHLSRLFLPALLEWRAERGHDALASPCLRVIVLDQTPQPFRGLSSSHSGAIRHLRRTASLPALIQGLPAQHAATPRQVPPQRQCDPNTAKRKHLQRCDSRHLVCRRRSEPPRQPVQRAGPCGAGPPPTQCVRCGTPTPAVPLLAGPPARIVIMVSGTPAAIGSNRRPMQPYKRQAHVKTHDQQHRHVQAEM